MPSASLAGLLRIGHVQFTRRTRRIARNVSTETAMRPSEERVGIDLRRMPTPNVDRGVSLSSELQYIKQNLLDLLGSSSADLTEVSQYYFRHSSKQIRPLLVLLFSIATNGLGSNWEMKQLTRNRKDRRDVELEGRRRVSYLDKPLSRTDVLNDWNPNLPQYTSSFQATFPLVQRRTREDASSITPDTSDASFRSFSETCQADRTLLPTQLRLAQIVEMIHVATILHDDVIDESPTRRGAPSGPARFGSKSSILAGNFLCGRALTALSRLDDTEVVELIAGVIAKLVDGEILQMKDVMARSSDTMVPTVGEDLGAKKSGYMSGPTPRMWNLYLQKTYLKTASLMAKGARAAVVLGGAPSDEIWPHIAYAYGRNLGIAFQLIDDVLDYEAAEDALGKPGGADLQLGLATGPALFAWEEHPSLGPMILRNFKGPGDVEAAKALVRDSSGIQRTRNLATIYAEKAVEVVKLLPDSAARTTLESLGHQVVDRVS